MSGSDPWRLITAAEWSTDMLAAVALLGAVVLLFGQLARAGLDVLSLIERVRTLLAARRRRKPRKR